MTLFILGLMSLSHAFAQSSVLLITQHGVNLSATPTIKNNKKRKNYAT